MANVDMCEHDWPGSGCKKCFPPKAFDHFRWPLGTRVTKTKGSQWTGKVVGFYSTSLTAEGYAVESETEHGSKMLLNSLMQFFYERERTMRNASQSQ